MRVRLVFGLLILILFCFTGFLFAQDRQLAIYNVGLVIDGPWGEENQMLNSVKQEILELTRGEFDVHFPPDKTIEGDWTLTGVKSAINQLLTDEAVDIIITLGSISSFEVCRRAELSKPVIAPYILDAGFQDIRILNGTSGIVNLNYISVPAPFNKDIGMFQEVVPFKTLAVLINEHLLNSFPELEQNGITLFQNLGIPAKIIGVGRSVQGALAQLSKNIEAVYILPIPHISDREYDKLVQELIKKKLPGFSYRGEERVKQGLLVGLNQDVINRVARRVALNVQRILLGEKTESIPVTISLKQQLTINEATSRAIGISPPWAVITEAKMVGQEQRQIERKLDLYQVIREAVKENLDLSAKQYYVLAGKQNVNQARSKLLPSVDMSGTYLKIDKDRAESSFGQQAERTLSGSLTATQVLYSEPAWANLSINKNLLKTRELELEQLRLDIIQDAATAYLNVLRTKTFERINQENLNLTRQNLDIARIREVVGVAGPSEVFRWESQIASNRKTVIEANTYRNLAEIFLNRVLHRPIEESFTTKEIDLNDPILITSYSNLFKFIENRQIFRIFRQFMVEETFENSPELAALDVLIAVQERILKSATNSFFMPTVALQGNLSNLFSRTGSGSAGPSPADLPPQFSFFAETFKEPKDLSWSLGINLSFPLFTGGEKFAVKQKTLQELSQLRIEREAVSERIEQRIRTALHLAGASKASIEQARLASEAAARSLNVVQNSYSEGLVSIVELLDAQQAALFTDQVAANSLYDFLIDLMEVERAYGKFNFFSTEQRRKQFFERADAYLEKEGMVIR